MVDTEGDYSFTVFKLILSFTAQRQPSAYDDAVSRGQELAAREVLRQSKLEFALLPTSHLFFLSASHSVLPFPSPLSLYYRWEEDTAVSGAAAVSRKRRSIANRSLVVRMRKITLASHSAFLVIWLPSPGVPPVSASLHFPPAQGATKS